MLTTALYAKLVYLHFMHEDMKPDHVLKVTEPIGSEVVHTQSVAIIPSPNHGKINAF